MLQLDFLRHGQLVGGARYRGDAVDDPLTAEGLEAMWQAVHGGQWDAVVTSPMQRCRVFAESYAATFNLPLRVDTRLREMGQGAWEGLTHEEVLQHHAAAYAAYKHDPLHCSPPGGEPIPDFVARVREALAAMRTAPDGARILVVCHTVVIRAALLIALDAPLASITRISIDYASMLRLQVAPWGWMVDGLNLRPCS